MSLVPYSNILTQNVIHKLFNYNYNKGFLLWKIDTDKDTIGEKVGYINSNGYRVVTINSKSYYVHRLIWIWCYGYNTENFIDHIDRKRHNNRITNLREVTQSCNMRNASIPSSNKSGIKGVFWRKDTNVWQVQITVNKRQVHIGYYDDIVEAIFHRFYAEQCAFWETCDIESPAALYVKNYLRSVR